MNLNKYIHIYIYISATLKIGLSIKVVGWSIDKGGGLDYWLTHEYTRTYL